MVTTLSGALLALIFISRFGSVMALGCDCIGQMQARDNILAERLPYGVAIACGGIATLVGLMA